MNDDHTLLSRLLRCWQISPTPPSDAFCCQVWKRISEIESRASSAPIIEFPRRLRLAACWAAALAAFGGSAAAFAYDSMTRDERMAKAHARSIDPMQLASSSHSSHRH